MNARIQTFYYLRLQTEIETITYRQSVLLALYPFCIKRIKEKVWQKTNLQTNLPTLCICVNLVYSHTRLVVYYAPKNPAIMNPTSNLCFHKYTLNIFIDKQILGMLGSNLWTKATRCFLNNSEVLVKGISIFIFQRMDCLDWWCFQYGMQMNIYNDAAEINLFLDCHKETCSSQSASSLPP